MQSTDLICEQIENAQAEIQQILDRAKSDERGHGESELELLKRHIADLNFSRRLENQLLRLNVVTIGDFIHKTALDFYLAKGFGLVTLTEVCKKLTELVIMLRDD